MVDLAGAVLAAGACGCYSFSAGLASGVAFSHSGNGGRGNTGIFKSPYHAAIAGARGKKVTFFEFIIFKRIPLVVKKPFYFMLALVSKLM